MKILIGTNNENKLKQYERLFDDLVIGVEVFSLKDLSITDDVAEDADNLLDNAKAKAKFYAEKSGLMAVADDVGLYVDALNGEPGIHAKRWHEGTEADRNNKLLELL